MTTKKVFLTGLRTNNKTRLKKEKLVVFVFFKPVQKIKQKSNLIDFRINQNIFTPTLIDRIVKVVYLSYDYK